MASTPDLIQNYEELFADRYTLEDKEYQKYVQCPPDTPPIVEDWLNRCSGSTPLTINVLFGSWECTGGR